MKLVRTKVRVMAKDGTARGGARVGAGRKSKALTEKLIEGRDAQVMQIPADMEAVEMPPVKEYMKEDQRDGKPLGAEDIYTDTWKWLEKVGCAAFVNPLLIEQYSMTVARWIQCEKAISEFGPYNTWDRSIMASAINELSKDPEYAPAVIAIDTLYSGESGSEGDKALAEAAENAGNVITASAADFGTSAVFGGDRITLDDYSVQGYEEPYKALADVTARGHINAMYDMDGVMRHALLYVKPDEETVVYSMAFTAALMYSESKGIPVEMPAVNERGQFYVPYSSGPGGFYDGVSLADIVNGEIPPEYYAGKIVLIGPYTAGLQDSYFTPVDRSIQMYGVEIQANVIRSILDGSFKTEAPDLLQLLYVFIICFMIFYLCMDRKIDRKSVV